MDSLLFFFFYYTIALKKPMTNSLKIFIGCSFQTLKTIKSMLSSNFSSPEMGVPWGLVKKGLHFNSCLINCWMLLFDITSKKSFEQLPSLHEYNTTKANTQLSGFIVVGTKLDLAEERRISEIEAAAFSRSIGADYVAISSKTGKNVSTLMPSLLAMHRKYLQSKAKRQKEAKKCILL